MRLMIDANIILDVLMAREPYVADSTRVSKLCETDIAEGHVSTLTFANLIYILRKELNPDKIEEFLKVISLIYKIDDLTHSDISNAAALKWDDFEDAVQASIAKRINADYIITRNVKDFKDSSVTALTPSELLAEIKQR
jgi:predicted nucleic acid-binding protein